MVAVLSPEELSQLVARTVEAAVEPLRQEIARMRDDDAPKPDDMLDSTEAARLAGVSTETICDWIARGLAAGKAPGSRSWRIKRADLELWLSAPKGVRIPRRKAAPHGRGHGASVARKG